MQPSFTVSSYVIVSMLLDATRARTFTMRPGLEATGALIGVVAAFKFTLMLLLEVRTRLVPQVEAQNIVEELTGGFLNRTVMAWVNALLLTGFRRNLRMDDLKNLDETYSARYLDQQFSKIWDKSTSSYAIFTLAHANTIQNQGTDELSSESLYTCSVQKS